MFCVDVFEMMHSTLDLTLIETVIIQQSLTKISLISSFNQDMVHMRKST